MSGSRMSRVMAPGRNSRASATAVAPELAIKPFQPCSCATSSR